ncbi:hypothetical protein [Tamlana crocina]|uniref:Auto-transporter adhesin head GIN domain-containing protein n=1 Tax=Tamlana crocina TaxID=393006 RepID=A0ABX1DCE4_9FLAO|nr:hypothetical protein [Tamlana crocina]NJX15747.1 hypothetical protein [Tamlana crocina]
MKTNLYILIVFLLTVTLGNAQDAEKVATVETAKTVTVEANETVNNDTLLIDAAELKETVARSSSDIRIYLNRQRKVGNITLVFPKINKAVKA